MSSFSALKTAIQAAIKQNGNNAITGDILQEILLSIVSTLGDSAINNLETGLQTESQTRGNDDAALSQAIENEATARGNQDTQLGNLITGIKNNIDNGYVYAGIATPSTTPVSGRVFYVATQAGTYTNLGNTAVKPGISIMKYNGSAWSNEQVIYTDGGVFDVSAYNGGATYASLEALLSDANLSTIIPSAVRKGGMSIKFVQTDDNKYVQARCMAQNFTTDVTQWQGVDDEPTAGSENLVESGGVYQQNINSGIIRNGIISKNNDYYITPFIQFGGGSLIWHPSEITDSADIECYDSSFNKVNQYGANSDTITRTDLPATYTYIRACFKFGSEAGDIFVNGKKVWDNSLINYAYQKNRMDKDIDLIDLMGNFVQFMNDGYAFVNVATRGTVPITPFSTVEKFFYIAHESGTYTNFLNGNGEPIVVDNEGITFLLSTYSNHTLCYYKLVIGRNLATKNDIQGLQNTINDIIYDISVLHPTSGVDGGNTYTLKGALLVIPIDKRTYGMRIKYIDNSTQKYVWCKYIGTTLENEFTISFNWITDDYLLNKTSQYLDYNHVNLLTNAELHIDKLKQSSHNISDSNTYSYFEVNLSPGEYIIYPRVRIILNGSDYQVINSDLKEPITFTVSISGTYTINVYTRDLEFVKLFSSSYTAINTPKIGWVALKENVSPSADNLDKIDGKRLFNTTNNLLQDSILTRGYYKTGSSVNQSSQYSYFSLILAPGEYKIGPNSRFITVDNSDISNVERKGWYTFTIDKYRMVDISVFTIDIPVTKLCVSSDFAYDVEPYGWDIFKNNVTPKCNVLAGKKVVFCGDSFTEYTAITGGSPEQTDANYDFDAGVYKTYPWWIWKRNGFAFKNEAKSGTCMTHINGRTDAFSDSRYKALGIGVDYIILKFGINDNNNHVTIGTISDNVNTTFYGAWNVVLSYLREHYPLAKIGIIISNGISDIDYVNAEINIAKKWGCSYLNEALGEDIPVFMRTSRTDVDTSYRQTLIETFSVNYPSDTHPNVDWHQYESTIVENWMRSL